MPLSPADVSRSLEMISGRLYSILENEAQAVLHGAKAMVYSSHEAHLDSVQNRSRGVSTKPWGFRIEPNSPLRFKKTNINDLNLRVDLFLTSYWDSDPGLMPCELTLAIRVWSLDKHIYFRDDWDAKQLSSQINANTGRVMSRLHFDLANKDQPGPKYHLQVGGKPHDDEFHWFPDSLGVPRILHPPMDLVLATELIAANFYPEDYEKFKREAPWVDSMRTSQEYLLAGYFDQATKALKNKKSLLDTFWNIQLT